jgi:hypothetical protein
MTEYVKWMPRNHGDYPPFWAKDMLASVDEDGEKVNADWAWLAWSTYYVPYEAVHGVRREVVEEGVEPVDMIDGMLKEIKSRVLMIRNEAAANPSPEFMGREGKAYQRAILDIYDMLDAFEKERSDD